MVILTGKTCSGKNLVRDKLVNEHGFKSLITYTTRPMRPGEIQDVTYHFISEEEFDQKVKENFFVEWEGYKTNKGTWYYGSSDSDIAKADNKTVAILTPDGIRDIISNGYNPIVIYIYSNLDTIKNRLKMRKDDEEEAKRRIASDIVDFHDVDMLANRIVYNNMNDDIEDVVNKMLDYYYKKVCKK